VAQELFLLMASLLAELGMQFRVVGRRMLGQAM